MTDPPASTVPDRPMLRGERVWLRPLEERDMPAYVAGINDTEVGGWAGYRWPMSLDQARAWLARQQEASQRDEGFFFAVCELEGDRFIGTTWLNEKVGFRVEGVMRRARQMSGRLADVVLMAILRDEWKPSPAA